MTVLSRLGNIYAFLFGWPFLRRLNYSFFYLNARALGLLNYVSARVSGENDAIAYAVARKENPIIFDVGANEGQWIAEVLAISSQAKIHAFEPQKKLAEAISEKFPSVKVNNVGVGDEIGYLDLYDYSDHVGSQHASLLEGVIDGIHRGNARIQRVKIETLDGYCAQNGISYIDFLKIDVEGFEFKVLQGASNLLRSNKIGVVQFEFNEMNVVAGSFMRNFFELLSDNFKIYRLLPHGMTLLNADEHWFNEQFVYQNILAVRK